jgi:hypothetical protein
MNCDFRKCTNEARWNVTFEFRSHHNAEPTIHTSDVYVCGYCRSKLTPDSLLNDRAFQIASAAIVGSGKESPDPNLTTIQWKQIT